MDRACSILVTGGTGFIGSHITVELLRRGYQVLLLARANKRVNTHARVEQLLKWFGMGPMDMVRLKVIEASIEQPDLGLNKGRYDDLANSIDEIIHCASHTAFSERKRTEVERTNIQGLQCVLDLAAKSKCYFLHHMSTAYVAGKRNGFCREDFVETTEFTNVYEETKYKGERISYMTCVNQGIRLNVYRPSIVYGSSEDGRSLRFNALYYPVRTVLFLKNIFMKDIKEEGGKRAEQMGVKMGRNSSMRLPIRIEGGEGDGINLVPIDFLVKAFMEIMDTCLEGDVFHIVNQRPMTIDALVDYTTRYFNLEGIQVLRGEDFHKNPRSSLEIIFDNYVDAYKPYMRDTRIFNNDKTRSILEKKNIKCPDLDYNLFSSCIQYAIETGWGANLFEKQSQ